MVKVDIRDNNRIIVLDVGNKIPIKSRQNSLFFHSSFELLACALGSCVGTQITRLCREEEVSPSLFQSIHVNIDNFKMNIIIQCPKDFDNDFKNYLKRTLENCEIAQMLHNSPEITFTDNTKTVEELTVTTKKRCCGG